MKVKGISQFNKRMRLLTTNPNTAPFPSFSPSDDIANPNDGGDLGTGAVPWNNLNVKQIRLRNGGVIVDIASIAYDTDVDGTVYNVPQNESHLFKEHDGAASTNTLMEIHADKIDAFDKVISNIKEPVLPKDAATKASIASWKKPVRAKPDGFTFLFPNIQQVIDGVTLVEGDRILLTDELNPNNNGIYYVAGPFVPDPVIIQAPLMRPPDFFFDSDMVSETFVAVEEGDNNKETLWHLVTPNPIEAEVTDQEWKQFAPKLGGQINDVQLGTADLAEQWIEDTGRDWIGCDNGDNNRNIILPIVEPGGFTDSYTLTADDFPDGAAGWDFLAFGVMATWTVENLGASTTYEYKIFINGRELSNPSGSISTWLAPSAYTTIEDVKVGDTLAIKVWSTSGSTDLVLRQRGIMTFPKRAQCSAKSNTVTAVPTTFSLIGTLPPGVTAELDEGEIAEYYITNDQIWVVATDNFPDFEPYNYGFSQMRILQGETMTIPAWDRDTRTGGATNRFPVPFWNQPIGNYRSVS